MNWIINDYIEQTNDDEDFRTKDDLFDFVKKKCLEIGVSVISKETIGKHIGEFADVKTAFKGEKGKQKRVWLRIKFKEVSENQNLGEDVFSKMDSSNLCYGSDCEFCNEGKAYYMNQEKRLACEKCAKTNS